MGGHDQIHSGLVDTSDDGAPTYTAGALKWTKTLPSSAVATTGVVIGNYLVYPDDVNGYRFYVGANDDKVYCYKVTYNSGDNTFSVATDPDWTYTTSRRTGERASSQIGVGAAHRPQTFGKEYLDEVATAAAPSNTCFTRGGTAWLYA